MRLTVCYITSLNEIAFVVSSTSASNTPIPWRRVSATAVTATAVTASGWSGRHRLWLRLRCCEPDRRCSCGACRSFGTVDCYRFTIRWTHVLRTYFPSAWPNDTNYCNYAPISSSCGGRLGGRRRWLNEGSCGEGRPRVRRVVDYYACSCGGCILRRRLTC